MLMNKFANGEYFIARKFENDNYIHTDNLWLCLITTNQRWRTKEWRKGLRKNRTREQREAERIYARKRYWFGGGKEKRRLWNQTLAGRACNLRRRNKRRKKFPITLTTRQYKEVIQRGRMLCKYCGRVVVFHKSIKNGDYRKSLTLDHVDPNGGTSAENLVVCCASCNSRKSTNPHDINYECSATLLINYELSATLLIMNIRTFVLVNGMCLRRDR